MTAISRLYIAWMNSSEASIYVTVSGGVSEIRPTDACCADIVKRSDAALYCAKQTGRNRVCIK
ncbi:MAG: diguanylate cyclase domain-containing protein [Christensenellales bacterium]